MTDTLDTREGLIFTPLARGEMPDGVRRLADDPEGRLELRVLDYPPMERGKWSDLHDIVTGEDFLVRPASCGLACFCGAEAVWVH